MYATINEVTQNIHVNVVSTLLRDCWHRHIELIMREALPIVCPNLKLTVFRDLGPFLPINLNTYYIQAMIDV